MEDEEGEIRLFIEVDGPHHYRVVRGEDGRYKPALRTDDRMKKALYKEKYPGVPFERLTNKEVGDHGRKWASDFISKCSNNTSQLCILI